MEKNLEKIKKQYESAVAAYIKEFCKKQECDLEYWVADQIGGIACFGDVLYFNFVDILFDINTNQPKNQIINWLYESIDDVENSMSYYSYSLLKNEAL